MIRWDGRDGMRDEKREWYVLWTGYVYIRWVCMRAQSVDGTDDERTNDVGGRVIFSPMFRLVSYLRTKISGNVDSVGFWMNEMSWATSFFFIFVAVGFIEGRNNEGFSPTLDSPLRISHTRLDRKWKQSASFDTRQTNCNSFTKSQIIHTASLSTLASVRSFGEALQDRREKPRQESIVWRRPTS